jgi:phosphatidylinositol glycan class B
VSAEASFLQAVRQKGGLDDPRWSRFLGRALAVAFLLIVVAAFLSDGYYHPDEHFQTLEFASFKLGTTPAEDLPWEFRYRIRSFVQPGLYFLLVRGLEAVGVHDPFLWTLAFRLVSGLSALLALGALALGSYRWFAEDEARRYAVGALCLVWYMPYLAVRTSSETLGGSAFLLGFALLSLFESGAAPPLADVACGALLGLAFDLRFALGVAIGGLLLWAVAIARIPARRLALCLFGLSLSLGLGVLVDRWGYGAWELPAVRYFTTNLVQGQAAGRFGERPWYGFVTLAAENPLAPLVLILMAGSVLAWCRKPLHPLTWASAPLVLVHTVVQHKELRFLFPVAPLAPLLLVLGAYPGPGAPALLHLVWGARRGLVGRLLLAINLLALVGLAALPLRPELEFQRYVRKNFPSHFEAYLVAESIPWGGSGLPMDFYKPRSLVLHRAESVGEVEAHGQKHFLLITGSFDRDGSPGVRYRCDVLYRGMPYAARLALDESDVPPPFWNLYRCHRPEGLGEPPREPASRATGGPGAEPASKAPGGVP